MLAWAENRKSDNHHWVLHNLKLVLVPNFILNSKLKRACWVRNRKNDHHHWVLLVRISVGTKFQLKLTTLTFWTKLVQKVYFRSKIEKVNITIEFSIFGSVLVPNFSLNWQFGFFGPNFSKKGMIYCYILELVLLLCTSKNDVKSPLPLNHQTLISWIFNLKFIVYSLKFIVSKI